jgi:maltose alpha-D-glucosyltransferase/alpha-amylase
MEGCSGFRFSASNKELYTTETKKDSLDALWFKNIIIYNLDIEVFKDSNNDGIGDIRGLTEKLGYIDSLGIDVIWLAPFQPTPNKDDGYDVSDYCAIDPRLGTWQDLAELMEKAKQHHLRIIMDLSLNHTSNEHSWFIQSKDPTSPYRSWYSWSLEKPSNRTKGMGFPGVEKEIWSWDSSAQAYYYHRFYTFEPDLNTNNPAVQQEVKHIIQFWLDKGMSGFRIDAVPFFVEVPETKGKKFERRQELLIPLRQLVDSLKPNAIFLGEINVPPKEDILYFGESGERMNMIFNFFVNQYIFYALASENTTSLKDALSRTSINPPNTVWGQFLRNHDEVDLGKLTKHDKKRVYKEFGPEPYMQLYNRGIRRRLAPMLANRQQMELAYSLLFSLPSTPVIRYGDELGMGDDLRLKERLSVRTPMQWNDKKFSGFTNGNSPIRPVIDSGAYSYRTINVAVESEDKNSLLNWTRQMILLRKSLPEISYGKCEILKSDKHVLMMRYVWQGKKIITIHNFSNEPVHVTFNENGRLACLSDSSANLIPSKNNIYSMRLPALAYKWYKVLN